jgi:radical SAM protein with 4Fe4S-binding SPASM domain
LKSCAQPHKPILPVCFLPNPFDFAIHFQKSREIGAGYGIEVVYASDTSDQPVVSSCPVGKDTAIVSPDGRISCCYLLPERWNNAGLDLDFGLFAKKGDLTIEEDKIDAIRSMVENKPRCSNCFCQWSCAGGCHVGITYPGSNLVYDNFCKQTRLISAFTLLENLGLQKNIDELTQTPKALQIIVNQESDKIQALN